MIRVTYIFLLGGMFSLLELLLRTLGLFFPFCGLFVFYLAIAFGRNWGIAAAVFCGLMLDFGGMGASHPWSVLIFGGVAYLSRFWIHRVESDAILMNFLPGLVIPFLVWILSAFFFSQHFLRVLTEQFPVLFPAAALSSIWLPMMIFLLDNLNAALALPLFTDAGLRQKLRSR